MILQHALQMLMGRYKWAVTLGFIALCGFFTAKIINVFVYRSLRELPSLDQANTTKRAPVVSAALLQTPALSAKTTLERNLMGARREDLNPKPSDAPKPEDSNKVMPCTIASNVVGVISGEQSGVSFVVYRDTKTQETGVYSPREGRNHLPGDITLLEVHAGEAKFRKDGHIEVCIIWSDMTKAQPEAPPSLPPSDDAAIPPGDSAGISKVSENEYAIEQKKIQWVQEHLNEVATDARIVPAFQDGKSKGFKLFSIRPGSVYQQIGLQNGDVIEKINGYEMNSPDKALEIYGKLRDAKSIQVQLERRGTPKTVTYQIR